MQASHHLPELHQLEALINSHPTLLRSEELVRVTSRHGIFPIHAVSIGSASPDVPVVAFVGGIHGLERIGSQIILAFLETLVERAVWDEVVQSLLDKIRILFLPIMNPVGMHLHRRANGNGVDLMRNSPIESERSTFMVGGQRVSAWLPWYRGEKGRPLERESQALIDCIKNELFTAPFSLVVDCHSGFGMHDRIWFPYAHSKDKPLSHLAEVYQIRSLLFNTYPNLNYLFEPQSQHYLTHGDLWDFLYEDALNQGATMLPLTLELGSWLWIKKNPMQMRSALGMFHPIMPHRIKRVLRHHQVLFEFFLRVACSHKTWRNSMDQDKSQREALSLWYPHLSDELYPVEPVAGGHY